MADKHGGVLSVQLNIYGWLNTRTAVLAAACETCMIAL